MVLPLMLPLLGLLGAGYAAKKFGDEYMDDRQRTKQGDLFGGVLDQSMGADGGLDYGLLGQGLGRVGMITEGMGLLGQEQRGGQAVDLSQLGFGQSMMLEGQKQDHRVALAQLNHQQNLAAKSYANQLAQSTGLTYDQASEVATLKNALDAGDRLTSFVDSAGAGGVTLNPSDAARLGTEWSMAGTKAMGAAMGLDKLTDSDIEFIQSVSGNPLGIANLTGAERARFDGVQNSLRDAVRIKLQLAGVPSEMMPDWAADRRKTLPAGARIRDWEATRSRSGGGGAAPPGLGPEPLGDPFGMMNPG